MNVIADLFISLAFDCYAEKEETNSIRGECWNTREKVTTNLSTGTGMVINDQ